MSTALTPEHILRLLSGIPMDSRHHAFILHNKAPLPNKQIAFHIAQKVMCQSDCADTIAQCFHCRLIETSNHPDVISIERSEHNQFISIEQVRNFMRLLQLSRTHAPFKIGFIHKAHLLNKAAKNALLKLLEDPPENVMVFLFTESLTTLPDTIRSRCALLKVGKISEENEQISSSDSEYAHVLREPLERQFAFAESCVSKLKKQNTNIKNFEIGENFKTIADSFERILRRDMISAAVQGSAQSNLLSGLSLRSVRRALLALSKMRYTIRMNGNIQAAFEHFFITLHI